jgi:hypothetical protein
MAEALLVEASIKRACGMEPLIFASELTALVRLREFSEVESNSTG